MSPDTPDEPFDIPTQGDRIEIDGYAWPTADLDPVAKMRILAAGLPHAAIDEIVLDVEFNPFWSFIEDVEANTSKFEGGVNEVRILSRSGDSMKLVARTSLGIWLNFDCVSRPGWMIMRSRLAQIGMAARSEGRQQTRFVHFEGSTLPLGWLARPYFAWNIQQDFRRLRNLFGANSKADPGST